MPPKIPTTEEIRDVTVLIRRSLKTLVANDSDIFNNELVLENGLTAGEIRLNRKLHETTINHRFACYLEKNIKSTPYRNHHVDIEYNRNGNQQKNLQNEGGIARTVRPDIIIHTRTDSDVSQQHYLVIEAKKERVTPDDISKVKDFIEDTTYSYLFGLTVSYCSDAENVVGTLYYSNGQGTCEIPIIVNKQ